MGNSGKKIGWGGGNPTGCVIQMMGKTAPFGYLACDGAVYNIADYPGLAAYFEEQFESKNYFGGDGTITFAVPDLRGEFLRGTGTNSHANQGNGASVGSHQGGTEHVYLAYDSGGHLFYGQGYDIGRGPDAVDYAKQSSDTQKPLLLKVTTNTDLQKRITYFTSRPTNTSVLYCIKT